MKISCRIDGSNKRHHTLLYNPIYMSENKDPEKAAASEQKNNGVWVIRPPAPSPP